MTEGSECSICGLPSTKHCLTCLEIYCDACSTFYHKGSKSNHPIVTLDTLKFFKPSVISCSKHKEERIKIFCETCKVTLCLGCSFLHTGHSLKDLDFYVLSQSQEFERRKQSILKQMKDMEENKATLEKGYLDFEDTLKMFLETTKQDHIDTIHKYQVETKEKLKKMKEFDLDSVQDIEELNLIEKFDPKKLRMDLTLNLLKEEFEKIEGFTLTIENIDNPEFYKTYSDAYSNKTKDFLRTNVLADKLLKTYPLNLLALTLKAEARVGHELFKFISQQPVYDAFDEFAVAESLYQLQKKQEGITLLKSSADKGCPYAEHKLGFLYFNGDNDLKIAPNKREGIKYIQRAAAKGLALSQYFLGYCYYSGDGIKKDKTLAVDYYRLAAEQGYAVAEHKLGHCFENAFGVDEDLEEARKWYNRAAQKGHEGAASALDLLVSKIDHERGGSVSTGTYGSVIENTNTKALQRTTQPSLLVRARAAIVTNQLKL